MGVWKYDDMAGLRKASRLWLCGRKLGADGARLLVAWASALAWAQTDHIYRY